MPLISVRTSGPVEILVDGHEPPAGLRWRKHAALFVYLLLSPRFSRTRSHLLGLLWGDKSEAAARHSLNEALRMLRKAAGEKAVRVEGDTIALICSGIECDALAFDTAFAAERWRDAAALAHGEFLEGFEVADAPAFEDWMTAERERRRRHAIEALVAAAGTFLREGQVRDALRLAERATALDPLSERAACTLMRSRAIAGEAGAALIELTRLERALDAALGATPGAETKALAERIRLDRIGPERTAPAIETRRTPLVGAGAHLGSLLDALERCRTGRSPELLVIEGDTGTGKSRLAEEVVTRARLSGAVVTVARAVEADLSEPGGGLEALAAGGILDARGLAAATPAALAAFAARLPAWGDRFPNLRSGEHDPSLSHAFGDLVRAAGEEQQLLLVVDDAEWLDAESLLALLGCLRDGHGAVALLLTVDSSHRRREIDAARARIGRDLAGTTVRLAPMTPEAVANLTAGAFPEISADQRARLARRIHADSGGLPVLAVELLHAVRLGLELPDAPWPPPARTFDATRPGDLPDPLIAALRIGFRRLGEDARASLCALAVLGGRASASRIGAAAALDDERTLRALDELEWARWVLAEPRGYEFTAAVAREVIARDMVTRGQRQRILERAGRLTPA